LRERGFQSGVDSSPVIMCCDAVYFCGRIPTFWGTNLPPHLQDGPLERLYPTTKLHGLKMEAAWSSETSVSYHNAARSEDGGSMELRNVGILPQNYTVWRWRQHGAPKRWYPTTTLHGVTTWNNSTWNLIYPVHRILKISLDWQTENFLIMQGSNVLTSSLLGRNTFLTAFISETCDL
jgi:hypothetical protein